MLAANVPSPQDICSSHWLSTDLEVTTGFSRASLVAQMIKNLPPMRETWVRSLDQEDRLEKGMATHSSSLAWRIPWIEKPGGLQTNTHKFYLIVEESHHFETEQKHTFSL